MGPSLRTPRGRRGTKRRAWPLSPPPAFRRGTDIAPRPATACPNPRQCGQVVLVDMPPPPGWTPVYVDPQGPLCGPVSLPLPHYQPIH